MKALAATPIEQLPEEPQLMQAASKGGRRPSRSIASSAMAPARPGRRAIRTSTMTTGCGAATSRRSTIRSSTAYEPGPTQTRMSQMPAFGRDGMLQPAQIEDLTAYVRTISAGSSSLVRRRARAAHCSPQNCAACHGADAKGNREFGAPNLTDAIWLYGGDADSVTPVDHQRCRYGVMPRWGTRLDSATVKMLAAYVHSLVAARRGKGARRPPIGQATRRSPVSKRVRHERLSSRHPNSLYASGNRSIPRRSTGSSGGSNGRSWRSR